MRKSTSWRPSRYVRLGLAMAVAALAATPVLAATASAELNASVTVTKTCTIDNATLAFPPASFNSATLTQTANISYTCTNGLAAAIAPQDGGTYHGGGNLWYMKNGASAVAFRLYKGAVAGQPFDAGTSNDIPVNGSGNLDTVQITGVIDSGNAALATGGVHSANIVLVVTYTP